MTLRRRWLLLSLTTTLSLAGCSSGQDQAAPTPAAAEPSVTARVPSEQPRPRADSKPRRKAAKRALRYVALGDSLASGMNGEPSYADAYARLLRRRTKRKVELTNLGVPGLTSTELLDALRASDEMRTAVSRADVVTWDIGGNDLIEVAVQVSAGSCGGSDGLACLPRARDAFAQRWHAIVEELRALRRSFRVRLQTFTLYQPFATIRGVSVDALLAELDRRNAIIRSSDGQRGVAVAEVAGAFGRAKGKQLIDDDGLHPTKAGHRLIARALLSTGG